MRKDIDQANTKADVRMRFCVLGPVTVSDGLRAVGLGGPKQRTVMAMLIAGAGAQVSADSIIEAVWGDETLSNARRNVQTYVATLRSGLGDAIVKDSYGWRLAVNGEDEIDALAFEHLYESARAAVDSNPERASVALREALAMWRGNAYADIDAHGALDGEIARLTELRTAAQAARIDADLALGRDADLIGEIDVLLALHPYSERFRAQHMLALYRAGRQQESLRSYGEMRTVLLEELGVEPTPGLQELEMRILEQDGSLHAAPVRTVTRRAIVVVDPGDPIEIGHLPSAERDELLDRTSLAVRSAVGHEGDATVVSAGASSYIVLESPQSAARIAESVAHSGGGRWLRLAIDWGDVLVSDGGVSGAPVSRAAMMAAVGHEGQILLSADALQAIGSDAVKGGFRFETLGSHRLHGIDGDVLIYQLLVDGQATFPDLQIHRLPPPLPNGDSQSVPGYELRTPFGQGSIGVLHRAFQPSVGREVLVEVIGKAQSSGADFIRSFEADAQRLALLDHQNLASVIDYWRRPDGAFLVYRFPRGGTLAGGPAVDADRVIEHVGSALMYAHSFGMAHGSLRPDRVLLDEVGNASLIGFPIAGIEPRASVGFPAYIAPETITGGPATVAADVFALGVLAQELRSGSAAFDEPLVSNDPAIARALSDNPKERHGSVAEFLDDLHPATSVTPAGRYTETRNPYKGLAAFHERDARDFFGRSAAVQEFLHAMTRSRLLAIVGPSGVGKSSVARAGLIPAIRAGALPGSEQWIITDMLPGSHPFLELQRAFERVTVDPPIELSEALASRDPSALEDVARLLPDRSGLVVVIDQFEELFTLTHEAEREAFLDLITSTAAMGDVRFIVTLRADFLDRPLRYSEFGELLRQSTVMLRAPNASELTEAISRPARQVGIEIDPILVQRMVTDVHNQAGALPLLQHALGELFGTRHADLVDVEAFDEIGGISGSVAKRAESIYEALDPNVTDSIKQVFLRLVTVADDGPPTRRRVRLSALDDLAAVDAIDAFARARLLVYDNDPETRSPTVEVAHEALLTHWPRLAAWIDTTREELTLSRRLDDAIGDWESNEHNPGHLLTAGRLAQHQAWTATTSLVLTEQQQEFLAASVAHDDRLRTRSRHRRRWVMSGFAVAAAVSVILAVLASQNASNAADSAARAEAEALAANALAVQESDPQLALLLAVDAYRQSASLPAISALHRGLQGDRELMAIPPPEGSSGAAGIVDPTGSRIAVMGYFSSIAQLWEIGAAEPTWETTLTEDPTAGFRPFAHFWFSDDGNQIYVPLLSEAATEAVSGAPGAGFYTLDAATGSIVDFWSFPCLFRANPAGTQFVGQSAPFVFDWSEQTADGSCELYGFAGVVDIDSREISFRTPLGPGLAPTLSSDGRILASTSGYLDDDGVELVLTRVFDTVTNEVLMEVPGRAPAAVSEDGTRVLAGRDPTFLRDVDSEARLQAYQGDFNRVWFLPGERRVVGVGPAGIVRIFDTESGTEVLTLRGHTSLVRSTSVDLGGNVLVSSGFDAARVWDISSPTRGDLSAITLESMDENHLYLDAISVSDEFLLVHRGMVNTAGPAYGEPHRIDVVGITDGALRWSSEVFSAELGPAGLAVVQEVLEADVTSPGGFDGAAFIGRPRLVDAATGNHVRNLTGCDHYWIPDSYGLPDVLPEPGPDCQGDEALEYTTLEFSTDGSRLLGATLLGAVTVWDVETGGAVHESGAVQVLPHMVFRQGVRWAAGLSPDGNTVIIPPSQDDLLSFDKGGARPVVSFQDVATGDEVGSFETDRKVNFAVFAPESGRLVVAGDRLLLVDPDTLAVEALTRPQGSRIDALALSPDGRLAATISLDGSIAVWDIEQQRLVAEIPVIGDIGEGLRGVAFLDNETLVVAPEVGRQLLRFTVNPDTLLGLAQDSLNRGFRPEECATYDIDPCPTLEELTAGS